MDEKPAENRKCWHCGKELTSRNSWMATEGFDRGAPSFYCVGCQNTFHASLSKIVGPSAAFFYCCVMFNVPFIREAIAASQQYRGDRGIWGAYIAALRSAKYNSSEKWYGFSDGETDIRRAYEEEFGELNLVSAKDAKESKEKQALYNQQMWGKGPKSKQYRQEDYDTLNEVYEAMTADRPYLSDQSRIAVKNIAKWTVERDRCIEEKDFNSAQKLASMIEKEKESEQLRKKDEMPQDRARLDDIVLAVERAGLDMGNYDHLVEQLATYMFHSPYGYTRDAADQMLLLIRNCTAFNEGIAETDRLGDEFAIVDTLGEFAPEPDEIEKQIYRDLQLSPLHMGGDPE